MAKYQEDIEVEFSSGGITWKDNETGLALFVDGNNTTEITRVMTLKLSLPFKPPTKEYLLSAIKFAEDRNNINAVAELKKTLVELYGSNRT